MAVTYTDLHVHILPGLDDGPADWEESILLARRLWEEDIRTVAATPHDTGLRGRDSRAQVESLLEELRSKLVGEGLALEIVPGVEIMLEPDIIRRLETGAVFPLNSSRYVLVELPFYSYPVYVESVLFKLRVKGYRPILAHPERNSFLQERPELLYPLVKSGVLVQVTAGSITGEMGRMARWAARLFLRQRWVHVIASDAHSATWRPPSLNAAVKEASAIVGQDIALAMVTTVPQAILNDEDIQVEEPIPLGKTGERR